LNEEDTTSSSRIFIKILVQEMAEAMGMVTLKQRFDTDNPHPDDPVPEDAVATSAHGKHHQQQHPHDITYGTPSTSSRALVSVTSRKA